MSDTSNSSKISPTWKINLFSSAIATLVAEVTTVPGCTLKTHYQTQNINSTTSYLQTAKDLYKAKGLSGFYRASVPATLAQVLSSSLKYTSFTLLEQHTHNHKNHNLNSKLHTVANGVISGVGVSLFTHPLDFWRVQWQKGNHLIPLINQNGCKVFYQGYSKSFAKTFVSSALFFPLYTFSRSFGSPFTASFISAVISTIIMQPLDYLKTRHLHNKQDVWEGRGFKRYYKGLGINLARVVPHFIITMLLTEELKKRIK